MSKNKKSKHKKHHTHLFYVHPQFRGIGMGIYGPAYYWSSTIGGMGGPYAGNGAQESANAGDASGGSEAGESSGSSGDGGGSNNG